MKIAATGLLAPLLVRAAELYGKGDSEKNIQVAPGINSDFLFVDPLNLESEEDGDEATTPAGSDHDWSVLGGRGQFSIPVELSKPYGGIWGFIEALSGVLEPFSTNVVDEFSEQQISELAEISNFTNADANLLIDTEASLSTIYSDFKKSSSVIEVLKIFLLNDSKLYEKLLERNFEAIKRAVIDPSTLNDLVMTLIFGKSFDRLVEVLTSCSGHQISVDRVVAALLSKDLDAAFYDLFTNPAVLESSCFDWSWFGNPAKSEHFKTLINFALECPYAQDKPEFIARLLQDGADPSRSNYACLKVAAKNSAVESFKLLVKDRRFDAEVSSEALKLAIESKCYPIISLITHDREAFPAEAPFNAYFTARQTGDEEMLKALGDCPLLLSAKKFTEFMQISDVSDEEFMSIIKRRSPKSTASYLTILKTLAHREKAALFLSVLSEESVLAFLDARDLTSTLNIAIAKGYIEAVELLTSLSPKKFNKEVFSTFGLLKTKNKDIIDLVKPLRFKWFLTNDEALSLAHDQAWESLATFVSYKPQPDIFNNSITILRLAFDQDQVGFVKACLLAANIPFPKNPHTLSKSAEMSALFSGKK